MKSSKPSVANAAVLARPRHAWIQIAKVLLGLGLICMLLLVGQINLRSVFALASRPYVVVIAFLLIYLTIPLGAYRWVIVLRIFGLTLPFRLAYHFTAIGVVAGIFLPGFIGADTVRVAYAWRDLGYGPGRIAFSILLDRLLGLFALSTIAALMTVINWHQLQLTPGLHLLAVSVLGLFVTAVAAGLLMLIVPLPLSMFDDWPGRWVRVARVVDQIRDVLVMARQNPKPLLASFAIALVIQSLQVSTIVVIALTLAIGNLSATDYFLAAPLTLIANAVPLTPNGLGVGEILFDQMCHSLEQDPSTTAYSSIFFAFRALAIFVSLVGLISFVIYRHVGHPPHREALKE